MKAAPVAHVAWRFVIEEENRDGVLAHLPVTNHRRKVPEHRAVGQVKLLLPLPPAELQQQLQQGGEPTTCTEGRSRRSTASAAAFLLPLAGDAIRSRAPARPAALSSPRRRIFFEDFSQGWDEKGWGGMGLDRMRWDGIGMGLDGM